MSKKLFLMIVMVMSLLVNNTCAMNLSDVVRSSKDIEFFKMNDGGEQWLHVPIYLLEHQDFLEDEKACLDQFIKMYQMYSQCGIELNCFADYIHVLRSNQKTKIKQSILGIENVKCINKSKKCKSAKKIKRGKKYKKLEELCKETKTVEKKEQLRKIFEEKDIESSIDHLFSIIEHVVNLVNLDEENYRNVNFSNVLFSRRYSSKCSSYSNYGMCKSDFFIAVNFLYSLYDNKENITFNGVKINNELTAEDILDSLVKDKLEHIAGFKEVVGALYAQIEEYFESKRRYDFTSEEDLSCSFSLSN